MKYFKVLLVVALFGIALGCSKKNKTESESTHTQKAEKKSSAQKAVKKQAKKGPVVHLTLWHSYRGKEKKALETVTKEFNQTHPNIQVSLLQIPYDAFADKVTITISHKKGPDMFIFAHDKIGEWVDEENILEPITTLVPRGVLDHFLSKSVESLVYKHNLYGLPLAFKSVALFYNKNLVKKPPETVEQLIDIAKKNTDPSKGKWGLVYEAGLFYFNACWFHGMGAYVMKDDGIPHLNSDAAVKAMELIRSFVKKDKILPSGINSAMVTGLFKQGKAAMVINGPWFLAELNNEVPYGVTILPRMPGGTLAKPFLGTEAVFLSNQSKHKDAAVKFMIFLTSDKVARERYQIAHQMVANKSMYSMDLLNKDPIAKAFWVEAESSVIMPKHPYMQLVWPAMDMAISQAVFGDIDPKKALDNAQAKVVADIKKKEAASK